MLLFETHLQHKAKGPEHSSRHRNAHNIVDGGKDEIEMDPSHCLLGEVKTSHHIHQVILKTISNQGTASET